MRKGIKVSGFEDCKCTVWRRQEGAVVELDIRHASKAVNKAWNKGKIPRIPERMDLVIHTFGTTEDWESLIERLYKNRKCIVKAAQGGSEVKKKRGLVL